MKLADGQSVLEYVITLTLIIAGIVAAGRLWFRPSVEQMVRQSGSVVSKSAAYEKTMLGM